MAKFRINEWLKKWLQITLNKFLTLRRNEIKFIIFFFDAILYEFIFYLK